jgi:hypothetical protein
MYKSKITLTSTNTTHERRKRPGYWKDVKNQRAFFDSVQKELNIQTLEDWYSVPVSKIIKLGGYFVANHYNSSLLKGIAIRKRMLTLYFTALKTVYPEHQWIDATNARGYWRNMANQRSFLDQLAIKLNIHKPEDWNSVTSATVSTMGGSFLRYYGSIKRGIGI